MSWGSGVSVVEVQEKKSSPTQSDSRYLLISVATRGLIVVRDHGEHLRELLYPVIELAPNHLAHEEVEVSTEGETQTRIPWCRLRSWIQRVRSMGDCSVASLIVPSGSRSMIRSTRRPAPGTTKAHLSLSIGSMVIFSRASSGRRSWILARPLRSESSLVYSGTRCGDSLDRAYVVGHEFVG